MLGIISDTHGNLLALEALLADAKKQGVTEFICLGDVANFGPKPKETLELIHSLNCPIVLGNTDAYLLRPRTEKDLVKITEESPMFLDTENWCAEQLSDENKEYIKSWPMYYRFEYENISLLAFHATPKNYNDIIVPSTEIETVNEYLDGFEADIFLHGHTHSQYVRKLHAGRIMNPGSVGLPFINHNNRSLMPSFAEYAILSVEGGEANLSFRRVPYQLQDLVDLVKSSDMPHQDWWLEPTRF